MTPIRFGPTTFETGLVIFDKDGTLTHFDPVWQSIYLAGINAVAQAVGNPAIIRSELHATLGYDPFERRFSTHGPFATAANTKIGTIVATVLHRHARPALTWDEAEALVEHTFLAALAMPPDPALLTTPTDLPTLFGSLRAADIPVAVVTSDERAQTLYTLDIVGIGDLVGLVIASDDPYPKKPAPEAIWAACLHFGVGVAQAVMVGDSLTDMRMGRAAGVGLRVAVLTGPGNREDLAPYADVVLESIGGIVLSKGEEEGKKGE